MEEERERDRKSGGKNISFGGCKKTIELCSYDSGSQRVLKEGKIE